MEFDTAFGMVTGYLAELRRHSVDLHLMGFIVQGNFSNLT